MSRSKTVTIRLEGKTKAALDIFVAKWLAKTGNSLTHDKAIRKLLEIADPETLKQVSAAGRDYPPTEASTPAPDEE